MEDLSLDKCTVISIAKLSNKAEEIRYETVVKACFENFPDKFKMKINEKWPDGKKIVLSIQRCKDNGWIVGSEGDGYKITALGDKIVNDIKSGLSNTDKTTMKIKNHPNRVQKDENNLIDYIMASDLFKRYKSGKNLEDLTTEDFRRFLQVSFEADEKTCKERIKKMESAAKLLDRSDIISFLKILSKKFEKQIKTWGSR